MSSKCLEGTGPISAGGLTGIAWSHGLMSSECEQLVVVTYECSAPGRSDLIEI